jgi:adenylate cyclase
MERRLSAILAADVVGYSRLMQHDEADTFERLRAHRKEVFEPAIAKHQGRVFKLMGDGLLAEFASVVEAVDCAALLQREMAQRNDGLPQDRRIDVRVGVHVGDVIVEGEDRHGGAVNIAARLQQLAEPGGICVSRQVVDHVTHKVSFGFEARGEEQLKNIPEPVRIYHVVMDSSTAGKTSHSSKRPGVWWFAAGAAVLILALAAAAVVWEPWGTVGADRIRSAGVTYPDKPSLVVLPLDNLSDDKEQGYLADGITEDLTTELARLPGLFVISRNAAFAYRGEKMPPVKIAAELGVRYLLEGSVRRVGDEIRINAQLIDGDNGGHLWAERFDGNWSEVFSLQDKVIESVATALKLRLVSGPRMAEAPGATANPAAYDLYLRAYGLSYSKDPAEAASLLRQAVAIDPSFGQAWAELAWVYWISFDVERTQETLGVTYSEAVSKIKELLNEAQKHPSSRHYQLMTQLLIHQRKSDEGIAAAERAIALDPSDPSSYEAMSYALVFNGRAADAKEYLAGASRVDPKPSAYRHYLAGLIAFSMDQFDDAIGSLAKAAPEDFSEHVRFRRLFLLMAAHALLGRANEAASYKVELEAFAKSRQEPVGAVQLLNWFPFKQRGDVERLWKGLDAAGVPDLPYGYEWAIEDRLTDTEIASVVFGHELRGRVNPTGAADTGEAYLRVTSADGSAEVSYGSSGISKVELGFLCNYWYNELDASCGAIFRNPKGTSVRQNEYVAVFPRGSGEFSVVR